MLIYPKEAITAKTISRFNYRLYSNIGINMLKYNNDNSATFRLFQSLCEDASGIIEDLNYQPKFSLKNIEFTSIDRTRRYSISSAPGINYAFYDHSTANSNYIIGYSAYTRKQYTLEIVNNPSDFIRHSIPCDLFITGSIEHNLSNTYDLPPYFKATVDMDIANSQITLDVVSGVSTTSRDSDDSIRIGIYGKDFDNEDIYEEITINSLIEYVSIKEYSHVDYLLLIGNLETATVRLYPYINGEVILWSQSYIDREDFEEYPAILSIDRMKNSLVISKVTRIDTEYPANPEPVEYIPLNIETTGELITTYFIDNDNGLIYTSTDKQVIPTVIEKRFYCYPLIFPSKKNNQLDKLKTDYQSIKIEYYLDSINKECTFYVFPAERHNGIESLNITANKISTKDNYPSWNPGMMYFKDDEVVYNGSIYTCLLDHTSITIFSDGLWQPNSIIISEDIMLDSYRQNIESNRIIVPYETLFVGDSKECFVEFSTYGDEISSISIYIYEPRLDYLCVKNVKDMTISWGEAPVPVNNWLSDSEKSFSMDYKEIYTIGVGFGIGTFGGAATNNNLIPIRFGGVAIDPISSVFLYKLTNIGNVCVNNTTITNVFKTFYYDDIGKSVITSDTITSIRGSDTEV